MAFVKRNVGVQRSPVAKRDGLGRTVKSPPRSLSGTRPSPLTGCLTTSTGVASLDTFLGGHAGIVTGSCLLVEESGTTDFAGTLLKFFAAEGIAQGHHLYVVGAGEHWVRGLPGLTSGRDVESKSHASTDEEKMKIAWRYDRLGQHGSRRSVSASSDGVSSDQTAQEMHQGFCHSFDLAKRLAVPSTANITYIAMAPGFAVQRSPFDHVLKSLNTKIKSSASDTFHRIVIPSILSPAFYPPHASRPEHFLQFLCGVRSLLRQYPDQIVAMMTLPTELHRRGSGLVRWAEHLVDGVIELQPFAHLPDDNSATTEAGFTRSREDQPQGMLGLHKLPEMTERGIGSVSNVAVGDDLAFTLSRRKFTIRPFSLPPVEGEDSAPAQAEAAGSGALKGARKADIEF